MCQAVAALIQAALNHSNLRRFPLGGPLNTNASQKAFYRDRNILFNHAQLTKAERWDRRRTAAQTRRRSCSKTNPRARRTAGMQLRDRHVSAQASPSTRANCHSPLAIRGGEASEVSQRQRRDDTPACYCPWRIINTAFTSEAEEEERFSIASAPVFSFTKRGLEAKDGNITAVLYFHPLFSQARSGGGAREGSSRSTSVPTPRHPI